MSAARRSSVETTTEMSVRSSEPIRPFTISVPESGLADLRERLASARLAPEPVGGAEGYGVSSTWLHELAEYWKSTYDWRVWEDRLNQHPQFITEIDRTNVHFLHIFQLSAGCAP